MYFDFQFYRTVVGYVWRQKHWRGRNRTLLKLFLFVPLQTLLHALFFALDYVFFPALWRQRVDAPVFVVGSARSGTTLMHRLLAADRERFSYFHYWEMFCPSITERKLVKALAWLDRKLNASRIRKRLEAWDEKTFGPSRHIHEMGLWIPEEDLFVMHAAFVTQQWAVDLPIMEHVNLFYVDQLDERRRRRWMNFYKGCIKRQLLINGGDKTHLSKNPVMSGWVNAIYETFPDAKVLVMLRDPMQCIPSTLALLEYGWKARGWTEAEYAASLQVMTDIAFDCFELPDIALQKRQPQEYRAIDYRELVAEPLAMVESIYQHFGFELSESYRQRLLAELGGKKHSSKFEYSIEQFRLTPAEIQQRLQPFYQRYGWPSADGQEGQA